MNRSIWSFETDIYGHFFFTEILIDLISYFPLTQSEALELINDQWRGSTFVNDDILYHDLPDVWAAHLYWGKESVWWKKGDERVRMGLSKLKPLRHRKPTTYEMWEYTADEESEHLFIDTDEKAEFTLRGLLTNEYIHVWTINSNNYIDAKNKLYEFMKWTNMLSIK